MAWPIKILLFQVGVVLEGNETLYYLRLTHRGQNGREIGRVN
jgi:hypothetical protein